MSPRSLLPETRKLPLGKKKSPWYEDRNRLREFREALLNWFQRNGRMYPWRATTDPFKILVAEIMLQRTKAEQVTPVWEEFFRRFPDINSLARAPPGLLKSYFRKLGLVWRVRYLHRLSRLLLTEQGGKVPRRREELLKLPGVGEYIADAVLYSAWGEPVVAVDSNVCRVISRIFGFPVESHPRKNRLVREFANRLLGRSRPAEFNRALLDLAALTCTPRNPRCPRCPVVSFCAYAAQPMRSSVKFIQMQPDGFLEAGKAEDGEWPGFSSVAVFPRPRKICRANPSNPRKYWRS